MNNPIFFKVKKVGEEWSVIFVKENNEYKIISNDPEAVKEYLDENKDCILIGANNFFYDDIFLTSILKNGNVTGDVDPIDKDTYLPNTLDITQGISRNYLVDFNTIICSIDLPNFYALTPDEINEELVNKGFIIKRIYDTDERKRFLNWKVDIINKYNLPKKAYQASFGALMEYIIGLDVSNVDKEYASRKFVLDEKLTKELEKRNDPFLNDILKELKDYYSNAEEIKENEMPTRLLGDCLLRFNKQGIHGSKKGDYFDANGEFSYLYIDFNSFGPSILINNGWLNDSALYAKRYEEIRDIRLDLKAKKQVEQLFYKHILNAGLDDLNKVETKEGANVGLSLTMSGIMTMMLLYRILEKYNIDLIEGNTDGLIVKCTKKDIPKIKKEVEDLSNKLSLACDADEVKRIIHFDDMNYIMEFLDGKIKHLGVFGLFQDHPLNKSGILAIDEAIRNYYLFNIPVSTTLRNIRDNNNLKAFQIIKKYRSNEKTKYIKVNDEYVEEPYRVNRLYPVTLDKLTNTLYVKNKKGEFEKVSEKKGTRVKEGFYYFQLADRELPDINEIDLNYYIDKCYKIIDAHPKKKNIYITSPEPNRYAFVDLDGTLVYDAPDEAKFQIFKDAVYDILDEPDIDPAYYLFSKMEGSFVLQFLSICKKYKGYGTLTNFALFLKDRNLFPGIDDIKVYKKFVERYASLNNDFAKNIIAHDNSKEVLEKLKEDGYKILLYSNWFKDIQMAKLKANDLDSYFDEICTIEDYYAKSSVVGWKDILSRHNISDRDIKFMLGNGTSDIAPKAVNVPSIIVNHNNKKPANYVKKNGILIPNLKEIITPRFTSELEEISDRIRR